MKVKDRQVLAKFLAARPAALVIAGWILVVHVVGVALFATGFLLTRPVFSDVTEASLNPAKAFDRAVILVVDALRYDFAAKVDEETATQFPYFSNQLPFHDIVSSPEHGFLVKFIADPPTTTLQRLKGLTTGSLPAFIDAGSNFAGTKIEEDNWVAQMARRGNVGFVGDDTWQALYSDEFAISYPYDSLNVRDLDTVDNGVKQHMPRLIANRTLDIVIGHMLGVDHVGHRYGPNHPKMQNKLQETGKFISEIASQINDKTVLFVFGDHGMDSNGNHGGDSTQEVESALWVYSKSPKFMSSGPEEVNQIDFVPTISALLGLPIPFNNLGFPIQQAFGSNNFENAAELTAQQLSKYANKFAKAEYAGNCIGDAHHYQKTLLDDFRASWISFDLPRMVAGIAILVSSALVLIIFYNVLSAISLEAIARTMSWGAIFGSAIGFLVITFGQMNSTADLILCFGVGVTVGILLFSSTTVRFALTDSRGNYWTLLGVFLLVVQCLVFFSNSFVIWESRILLYFTATTFVALGLSCISGHFVVRKLGLVYVGWTMVVLRATSYFYACREENGTECVTTFYQPGTLLSPVWTLVTFSVLTLVTPIVLGRFYAIGRSYVGIAKLMFRGTTVAMLLSVLYWSLDTAETHADYHSETVSIFKVFLSRSILALGFIGGIYIWYRSELCIEVDIRGDKPKIEGYNNVYGSYAFLPLLSIFWGLLVVNKPAGAVVLSSLMYTLFAILDLVDLTGTKYTFLVPVLFNYVGAMYYFWTGHQATIPSIQWDTAFIAARQLSYPISAITVALNTLGPLLLTVIASVLVATWRRPPFKEPRQILAYVLRAGVGTSLVTTIVTTASMVAVTCLRRHLMTWKIFAPRFMLAGISLCATDLFVIFALLIAGHSLHKVTKIFS